jgi:septum formation topological specificity factor MinE
MKKMTAQTIEGFLKKLKGNGLSEYASELKLIVAMSRKRKKAMDALSQMAITLLVHLIKFISIPQARDKNKWRKEIKGYLAHFNVWNQSPSHKPWLSLGYIQEELNDILSDPSFYRLVERETYADKNKVLTLLKEKKSLRDLEIKLNYDSNNDLNLNIKNQSL